VALAGFGLDSLKEVAVEAGRAVAAGLAHCRATFYPDEGHISIIVHHPAEIVAALKANTAIKP
jgi:hypothetical protein